MSLYNWNPVLKIVMDIKHKYLETFKTIDYSKFNIGVKEITCLDKWIMDLDIPEYISMFKYLQLNQMDDLVLIRYGRYSDVFAGESDVTHDTFWYMYDGFYMECRSIVINVKTEEIVLSPFKKFKNLNEGEENQLDLILDRINNAKYIEVSNKLDGSMQSARWYNNEVFMTGSQAINKEQSWRLEDGYNILMNNTNYINALKDYPMYTFIFETISLRDSHVVIYTKEQEGLYLIGMRNITTGEQLQYKEVIEIATKYNLKTTQLFNKSFNEIMNDTKTLQSYEMEGYVLNIDGYYVKIKVDDYVKIHNVFSKLSSINLIIQSIADDTYDDLLSKIPEAHHDRLSKVANIVFKYIKDMEYKVNEIYKLAPKESKKEFMIHIDKNVDFTIKSYVRNKYLGIDNNYLRRGRQAPYGYKKLKDMGVTDDYLKIFDESEV